MGGECDCLEATISDAEEVDPAIVTEVITKLWFLIASGLNLITDTV